jgi:hypothetical protein
MEEKALQQSVLKTPSDYEAAMEQCLTRMQQLREQMNKDQTDIDRLKAETRAILAQLKAA